MLLLIVSHVVFRSDESDADVFEAEAESRQEADAGVDEGALVAGQLQGDEESEAAEEGSIEIVKILLAMGARQDLDTGGGELG